MKVEVIAIGNEILAGYTINSNAAFISQQLVKIGLEVNRHTVLSDDAAALRKGLAEALSRNDLVITTGGLGPTIDDITRKAVAEVYGCGFRFDEGVAADLNARYGDRFVSQKDQATVPALAKILKNRVGTAPGLLFDEKDCILIMMPGVPPEAKAMMSDEVLPYVKGAFQQKTRLHHRELHLFNVSESAVDPFLRQIKEQYPYLNIGIYPSLGLLTIYLTVSALHEEEADSKLRAPFEFLSRQFPQHVFNSKNGRIEEDVHYLFIEKGLTLSTAESCTGGSVAARLVRIPGASKYYLGSIIAYSNDLKQRLLNVSEDSLKKYGAVSEQVVKEMAAGLLAQTGSDYGLAVTGIAGPEGGTPDKPVGTVWGAVIRKGDSPRAWKIKGYGNREMIIERSVNALLAELLIFLR